MFDLFLLGGGGVVETWAFDSVVGLEHRLCAWCGFPIMVVNVKRLVSCVGWGPEMGS